MSGHPFKLIKHFDQIKTLWTFFYLSPLIGSKLFIDEIQIKSQCGIGNGVDSDIDLAFVLCQSDNCCSIEALPMVSADCNELDYFTNSQLGIYYYNFLFIKINS